MTYTDPPPGVHRALEGRRPPLSRLVGRRPTQGATTAAKTVIDDVQALVRAEIALARAEIADGVKAKVMGGAFFIAVAIIGWLAVQAFLVFLGFLFALFLPGWAAVGLVLLLLMIAMAVLGYIGYRKMTADDLSLSTSKRSIARSRQAAQDAVDRAKAHTTEGIEEARATVAEAVEESKAAAAVTLGEVRQRVEQRLGMAPTTPPTTTPPTTSEAPRP